MATRKPIVQLAGELAELPAGDFLSIGGEIAASIHRTTDQTLTTGTWAAIAFDGENYDVGNFHSNVTNNTRMTIPITGKYSLKGNARFQDVGTAVVTTRGLYFRLNGTTIIGLAREPSIPNDGSDIGIAVDWLLTAGDYVELMAYQASGGNLPLNFASTYTPCFSIFLIK